MVLPSNKCFHSMNPNIIIPLFRHNKLPIPSYTPTDLPDPQTHPLDIQTHVQDGGQLIEKSEKSLFVVQPEDYFRGVKPLMQTLTHTNN
uniref:Uncharacterized protein n=1 Tax=Meloidogyne enterolobii TaxID=390850 RepID=A0A6V7XBQ0_MELEN|nr:unnamed protein product [Meloidogyne enterolobii]